jgi:NDP-sugar pyrophosphorylase family protein
MRAAIVAGGLGTRLKQVVSEVPKCMALIAGRPFLEYQVNWLAAQGIYDIVLCLGYKSEMVKGYFKDGAAFGVRIEYSIEDKPLGTAGALSLARYLLPSTFLMLNGDTFVDFRVEDALGTHKANGAVLSMATVYVKDVAPYGEVIMDQDRRLLTFCEKGRNREGLINAGIYVIEKKILEDIPMGQNYSLEKEILPSLLEQEQPVYGFVHQGYFLDIGTPENYERAQKEIPGRFGCDYSL